MYANKIFTGWWYGQLAAIRTALIYEKNRIIHGHLDICSSIWSATCSHTTCGRSNWTLEVKFHISACAHVLFSISEQLSTKLRYIYNIIYKPGWPDVLIGNTDILPHRQVVKTKVCQANIFMCAVWLITSDWPAGEKSQQQCIGKIPHCVEYLVRNSRFLKFNQNRGCWPLNLPLIFQKK